MTILFTDVEGSTDLRTRQGDAAAHQILREHEELVRGCVAEHGGREVKVLGDGFMVAFGSARRALACATSIQRVVEEQTWRAPGTPVHVRIGVNTGEVVTEGDDLYGQAVNAAARIAARAKAGEILVSEVTRQLAGSGPEFTFRDRGRVRLKGFPDRWHLYGLVWEPRDRTGPTPVLAGRTPYVGRETERAELCRLLDSAIRGVGGLVMLGGEPGVGKTRLAEELMAEAHSRDMQVFIGHSHEMEGAAPYVAFVEVLESALDRAPSPQAFRQALGEEAAEVARLLPKLRRLCPDIPPPLELPAEQERRLLFNSVREVVARTAQRRPLLLVLDDLHWADDPTLFLLEHLSERLGELPVLVVATYRDTEVDVGRPLAKTFEDLRRRQLAHWMTLSRLPEKTVAQMLSALAGQDPPGALVGAIYAETEGNPFFLEEVYKYLVEENRLFDAEGRFRTDLQIGELEVPEGVRLVIGRRLQRLDETSQKVLGAAAVVGRAFSVELLEAMGVVDTDPLLDAVEEMERARLILSAPDPSGEDRFIFAHELIRQTVMAELSLTRRRRLHARAADAMEHHYAANLDQHASAIAHHLTEAAADPQRTFRYLVRAGQWALAGAAFEEALRHLEAARELGTHAGGTEKAAMLFELGQARRCAGSWDTAIDAWRESVTGYEDAGDAEGAGRVCAAASFMLAWASRFAEAVELALRGLAALGDQVSGDRGRLLGAAALCSGLGGDYQGAIGMVEEELAIAAELGDDAVLGDGLFNECVVRWGFLEEEAAAQAGLRSAELLRASGDLFGVAGVLAFTVMGLTQLGRFDQIRGIAAELEPLCQRVGHYPSLLQLHRTRDLMVDFWETADLDRLERLAQADMEECQRAGLPWVNLSLGWEGLAVFLKGDWDRARKLLTEGERIEAALNAGNFSGFNAAALFECLAYLGDEREALAVLERRSSGAARPGQPNGWGAWTLTLATVEGLMVLGDREGAAALYGLVVEGIDRTGCLSGSLFDGRLFQRTAGIAAMAGGHYDEAKAHFDIALRQAVELPHRPEEAHTQRWYAAMSLDRGGPDDRKQAGLLLRDAIENYHRMNMPRHGELAATLLAAE